MRNEGACTPVRWGHFRTLTKCKEHIQRVDSLILNEGKIFIELKKLSGIIDQFPTGQNQDFTKKSVKNLPVNGWFEVFSRKITKKQICKHL